MQTRRDQVQAHMFVMHRLTTGLLRGEPDAAQTPTGRTSRGSFFGLLVAALIAGVLALFGVISPGGAQSWRAEGALVIVKESGSRFLFLGGQLHPVLNEASARLLAGSQMTVQVVDQKSLSGAVTGAPVGLVGAPDSLPGSADLGSGPWMACGTTSQTGANTTAPRLTLLVDPSDLGQSIGQDDGVLVAGPDGTDQLLWDGHRLRLDTVHSALDSLGYATAAPFPVTAALLDALPPGPDLTAVDVSGVGTPGPSLAGVASTVGQVFAGPSGAHYLLTSAGLLPLTETQFDLQRGDPRTQALAYAGGVAQVRQLGPADIARYEVRATGQGTDAAGLPLAPPALAQLGSGQGVCAVVQPRGSNPTTAISVVDAAALPGQAPVVEPGITAGCQEADEISVRPGGGALVHALPTGGAVASTTFLITDTGVKYPVPSAGATQLGLGAVTRSNVPATLLALLPTGPSLDPAVLLHGGVVGQAASATTCGL